MGPEVMMIASLGSAVASGVSSIMGAKAEQKAVQAQAEADNQRTLIESQWAERRGIEERASAQRTAGDQLRQSRLLQSRLTASAGAGGGDASDPTVLSLFGEIEKEGRINAGRAVASGEQQAAGLNYQASLDRWTTAQNNQIRTNAARSRLASTTVGAIGSGLSAMSSRYPSLGRSSSGTGYGS